MNCKEKLLVIADVAFGNNVDKICKLSFSKTIDVQFGIYRIGECRGWLTINLKPTHGHIDWIINLIAFSKEGKHAGYVAEWNKYKGDFINHILDDDRLLGALKTGVVIAGRSKGGGEALVMAEDLFDMQNNIIVGAIEPPKVFGKKYSQSIEKKINRNNIIYTIYKNDIVPSLPFWFVGAGIKIQFGKRNSGLSVKDHINSTTDEKLIYNEIESVDFGNID